MQRDQVLSAAHMAAVAVVVCAFVGLLSPWGAYIFPSLLVMGALIAVAAGTMGLVWARTGGQAASAVTMLLLSVPLWLVAGLFWLLMGVQ